MKFPTLVYRCPGNHQCKGGSFSYSQVLDEDGLTRAIQAGWYPTLDFAANPSDFDLDKYLDEMQPPPTEAPPKEEKTKPLPRRQLEARAKELGIGFTRKTTVAELQERISEAEGFEE